MTGYRELSTFLDLSSGTLREVIEKAVRNGVSLKDADLRGARLQDAVGLVLDV